MSWFALVPIGLVLAYALGMPLLAARRARANVGRPMPTVGPAIDPVGPGLVYFFSPTCGPCRQMSPGIDTLLHEGLPIHKVDVSETIDVAMAWRVMMTPTTIVVRDGAVVDVVLGYASPERLRSLLDRPSRTSAAAGR